MQKPTVKFKTYKQSARVGGKIYGVADLSDPQIASVTMQEVIDYAKLHNYSASTLEALLSQVISGVADLVARDGRPRNLSDLLKFEPVIKGTFSNMEQSVTNQKVVIRPRLLKEIRVNIAADTFAWQNQNDTLSPILRSVAPKSDRFSEVNLASVRAGVAAATGFGWTLAGTRLAPNGWEQTMSFKVLFRPLAPYAGNVTGGVRELHLEFSSNVGGANAGAGFLYRTQDAEATDNAVALDFRTVIDQDDLLQCWYINDENEAEAYDGEISPVAGDIIVFQLTRTVGSGDTFTVEKSYTL